MVFRNWDIGILDPLYQGHNNDHSGPAWKLFQPWFYIEMHEKLVYGLLLKMSLIFLMHCVITILASRISGINNGSLRKSIFRPYDSQSHRTFPTYLHIHGILGQIPVLYAHSGGRIWRTLEIALLTEGGGDNTKRKKKLLFRGSPEKNPPKSPLIPILYMSLRWTYGIYQPLLPGQQPPAPPQRQLMAVP